MLYQVLGLEFGASEAEVRRAYRELALVHHPDKNPNDDQAKTKFQSINLAHQILASTASKRKYDEENAARASVWMASVSGGGGNPTTPRTFRRTTSFHTMDTPGATTPTTSTPTTPRTPTVSSYTPEQLELHRQREKEREKELARKTMLEKEKEQLKSFSQYQRRCKAMQDANQIREEEFHKLRNAPVVGFKHFDPVTTGGISSVVGTTSSPAATSFGRSETTHIGFRTPTKVAEVMNKERETFLKRRAQQIGSDRTPYRKVEQQEEEDRIAIEGTAEAEWFEYIENTFAVENARVMCAYNMSRLLEIEPKLRYEYEQIAMEVFLVEIPLLWRESQSRVIVCVEERVSRTKLRMNYDKTVYSGLSQNKIINEESHLRRQMQRLLENEVILWYEMFDAWKQTLRAESEDRWYLRASAEVIFSHQPQEGLHIETHHCKSPAPKSTLQESEEVQQRKTRWESMLKNRIKLSSLQHNIADAFVAHKIQREEMNSIRNSCLSAAKGTVAEGMLMEMECTRLEKYVQQRKQLLMALNVLEEDGDGEEGDDDVTQLMEKNELAMVRNGELMKRNAELVEALARLK
eukprot:PhF_6_TR11575/c0_g1_i1/m.18694